MQDQQQNLNTNWRSEDLVGQLLQAEAAKDANIIVNKKMITTQVFIRIRHTKDKKPLAFFSPLLFGFLFPGRKGGERERGRRMGDGETGREGEGGGGREERESAQWEEEEEGVRAPEQIQELSV